MRNLSLPCRVVVERGIAVRFTIEIQSVDLRGVETVLRRFDIKAINPAAAIKHGRSELWPEMRHKIKPPVSEMH